VPHLRLEADPGFFSRFQREDEIGRKLSHPYVLKFVPVERKSRPSIVTEYLRAAPCPTCSKRRADVAGKGRVKTATLGTPEYMSPEQVKNERPGRMAGKAQFSSRRTCSNNVLSV